jgi:hypothetical protein
MSSMRRMDPCAGHPNGQSDRHQKASVRVREPAPLRNDGVCRRDDWPFLYIYEDGKCFINYAPSRSKVDKTKQGENVGEALF